jgi:hypothetical protein
MKISTLSMLGKAAVVAASFALLAPTASASGTVPSVKAKDFVKWSKDEKQLYYHAVLRGAAAVMQAQGKSKQHDCVLSFPNNTDHGDLVYDYLHAKTKADARTSALMLEAVAEVCGDF